MDWNDVIAAGITGLATVIAAGLVAYFAVRGIKKQLKHDRRRDKQAHEMELAQSTFQHAIYVFHRGITHLIFYCRIENDDDQISKENSENLAHMYKLHLIASNETTERINQYMLLYTQGVVDASLLRLQFARRAKQDSGFPTKESKELIEIRIRLLEGGIEKAVLMSRALTEIIASMRKTLGTHDRKDFNLEVYARSMVEYEKGLMEAMNRILVELQTEFQKMA